MSWSLLLLLSLLLTTAVAADGFGIHDFFEPIDAADLEMTLNLEATLFTLLSLLSLSALLELRTILALFWEPHNRHDQLELHDRDRCRGRDDD